MSHTLVLNKSFYAVHIADWRKAVSLVYQGRAEVVDEDLATYDFDSWSELSKMMHEHPAGFVHTPSRRIAVPEVVRLLDYNRLPRREVKFSRRNIYSHYDYKCCYCGRRFKTSELNLDHVIPRALGGKTTWNNIVTACVPCNTRKGCRRPRDVGMRLLVRPSKPEWGGVKGLMMSKPVPIRESWQKLIDRAYWDSELKD